ncbi:MAG: hypothetical protein AB8B64_10105 [Granulosicoccus sp.]
MKLTQDVINRFVDLAIVWIESLPPEHLARLESDLENVLALENVDAVQVATAQITLLLDSEVVLSETRYSQLDGAPYDHSVQTILTNESTPSGEFFVLSWQGQEFSARWQNDGNVVKFLMDDLGTPMREYFYQDNTPSELVVVSYLNMDDEIPMLDSHVKIIAYDPDNSGVFIEFADVGPFALGVSEEITFGLIHALTQGQIDDDGGYATLDAIVFDSMDTSSRTIRYTGRRESFDGFGNLIAGTLCEEFDLIQGVDICEEESFVSIGPIGSSVTNSPYFFQQEDFDSLTAVEDVIQWTVEDLPDEIKSIAVVSANSSVEPAERELLCQGFRFVSGDTRMFCGATDEQLENTIVLELVNGKPGRIIPTAKLVQIQ